MRTGTERKGTRGFPLKFDEVDPHLMKLQISSIHDFTALRTARYLERPHLPMGRPRFGKTRRKTFA